MEQMHLFGINRVSLAWRIWAFILLLISTACTPAATPTATTQLTDLHRIDDLQNVFNQDRGKTRIILLAAPT